MYGDAAAVPVWRPTIHSCLHYGIGEVSLLQKQSFQLFVVVHF